MSIIFLFIMVFINIMVFILIYLSVRDDSVMIQWLVRFTTRTESLQKQKVRLGICYVD